MGSRESSPTHSSKAKIFIDNEKNTFSEIDLEFLKAKKVSEILNDYSSQAGKGVALSIRNSSDTITYLLTLGDTQLSFLKDGDELNIIYPTLLGDFSFPKIQDFELLKVIGIGGFSTVTLVRKKDSGKLFAMKIINKKELTNIVRKRQVNEERRILEKVSHPFIIKMEYAFQTENALFFVTQFCPGGDLLYHISARRFSEKMAQFYFGQIVLVIEYLHSMNIIYRDLKPDNILIDIDGYAKVTDFGLSRMNFFQYTKSTSFCGTAEYISPEMIKEKKHDRLTDFYELGVFLYVLLIGKPPFNSEDEKQLFMKIIETNPVIPEDISLEAKDLLLGLLEKDPQKRMGSISLVKNHPFFKSLDWIKLYSKELKAPIRIFPRNQYFETSDINVDLLSLYEPKNEQDINKDKNEKDKEKEKDKDKEIEKENEKEKENKNKNKNSLSKENPSQTQNNFESSNSPRNLQNFAIKNHYLGFNFEKSLKLNFISEQIPENLPDDQTPSWSDVSENKITFTFKPKKGDKQAKEGKQEKQDNQDKLELLIIGKENEYGERNENGNKNINENENENKAKEKKLENENNNISYKALSQVTSKENDIKKMNKIKINIIEEKSDEEKLDKNSEDEKDIDKDKNKISKSCSSINFQLLSKSSDKLKVNHNRILSSSFNNYTGSPNSNSSQSKKSAVKIIPKLLKENSELKFDDLLE